MRKLTIILMLPVLLSGCMKETDETVLLPVRGVQIPETVLSAAEQDALSCLALKKVGLKSQQNEKIANRIRGTRVLFQPKCSSVLAVATEGPVFFHAGQQLADGLHLFLRQVALAKVEQFQRGVESDEGERQLADAGAPQHQTFET